LSEVGQYFGERDHATVLSSVRKIDEHRRKTREVADAIAQIAAEVSPSEEEA
jgi:chromosomal replication initiation ATPase DnaA